MLRGRLLAFFILLGCLSLQGQNPDADSAASAEPSVQLETQHGKYVSGFEILSRIKSPNELRFYPNRVLARVRHQWYARIHELQQSIGGKQGATILEFEIEKDGSIGHLKTIESTNDTALDMASSEAITSAAPFPPLPQTYQDKTLKMRMHFGYDRPVSPDAPSCRGPNWGAHTEVRLLRQAGDGGVAAPKAVHSPDPEYSEQARREKYMSTVMIAGTVDPQGTFTDLCVATAAGEGLDERAMETVSGWRFEPATLEGNPVPVRIRVEVTFSLY